MLYYRRLWLPVSVQFLGMAAYREILTRYVVRAMTR